MRMPTLSFGLLLGSVVFAVSPVHSTHGATSNQDADSLANFDSENFSRQEWAVIRTLSPLPALPVDPTNKYRDSPATALLGQKLFFESRLSGPIQVGTAGGRAAWAHRRDWQDCMPQLPHAGVEVAL